MLTTKNKENGQRNSVTCMDMFKECRGEGVMKKEMHS